MSNLIIYSFTASARPQTSFAAPFASPLKHDEESIFNNPSQQQTCHKETETLLSFKPFNNVIHLFIFLQLFLLCSHRRHTLSFFCVCDNIKKEIYVNWIKWKTFLLLAYFFLFDLRFFSKSIMPRRVFIFFFVSFFSSRACRYKIEFMWC